jgi:hypothetical protein
MVKKQTMIEMDTERSIRQSVDATAKLQALQMEREDDLYRQLIDSIDNVAQTVEESSAFAQGKKLVERHPFLTGLLGPSIAQTMRKVVAADHACRHTRAPYPQAFSRGTSRTWVAKTKTGRPWISSA